MAEEGSRKRRRPAKQKRVKRAKRKAATDAPVPAAKQKRAGAAKPRRRRPVSPPDPTFDQVARSRRDALVTVDQPVALISQAPRSGGTLLRNLFDGHSQCHVHPYEWHFGRTRRYEWPRLPQDATPERWWSQLMEDPLRRRFVNGIRRNPTKGAHTKDSRSESGLYPFLLPPRLHRKLFLETLQSREPVQSEREILDTYLTALFNAWLDNHTLDDAEKRWVVAFAPRLAWGPSRNRFFDTYPDGHLISILRSPASWLASARGRQLEGSTDNNERLVAMWKRSATEMRLAKEEIPERVTILRFDDLVLDPERTMRLLADKLDIDFEDILIEPTFNSRPIGPNSSYKSQTKQGIITSPLTRHKQVLTEAEEAFIAESCGPLYEETIELAERPAEELQGTPLS